MKTPRLVNADKGKVRLASRKAIEGYFVQRVAGSIKDGWLDSRNRYRISATKTYEDDLKSASVRDPELIDYIAASAPAHLIDGWSYLGRATDAVLRGDLSAAIHLGYYAELRAAMSLLASEGIGVFSTAHPLIDERGTSTAPIQKITNPWNTKKTMNANTHKTVWPLLHHWGTLKRASSLIEEFVAPDGYTLRQWLDALDIQSSVRAISKQWLTCWGTDLTRLTDDHDSRNMASYRPSEFRQPPAPPAPYAIEFVADLWGLLEPAEGGRFPQLEKELLKRVVRSSRKPIAPEQLERNLGMSKVVASNWCSFLKESADSKPLSLSDKNSDVDQMDCSFQVISRAALLLFLATRSTRKHLVNAGCKQDQLEFFWRRLCELRFDEPPDDLMDIWSDMAVCIADANSWRVQANVNASLSEWRKAQPSVMNQMVSLELAAVWGLVS